jgi:hypothetical protein
MGNVKLKGRAWSRAQAWCRAQPPICWRCGRVVRWDRKPPDPDAATIGHRIPVRIRPDLLEDLANISPECWRCNHVAGGDPHYEPPRSVTEPGASRAW